MSIKSLKNRVFAAVVATSAILSSFADGLPGPRPVGSMGGKKIIGWTTAPANVNFVCADGERFGLRKKDDGLYIYRGMILIVR